MFSLSEQHHCRTAALETDEDNCKLPLCPLASAGDWEQEQLLNEQSFPTSAERLDSLAEIA